VAYMESFKIKLYWDFSIVVLEVLLGWTRLIVILFYQDKCIDCETQVRDMWLHYQVMILPIQQKIGIFLSYHLIQIALMSLSLVKVLLPLQRKFLQRKICPCCQVSFLHPRFVLGNWNLSINCYFFPFSHDHPSCNSVHQKDIFRIC